MQDVQYFLNNVYDVLAQNDITRFERDYITDLIDCVDTDKNMIIFKDKTGREFVLQFVATYAPATDKTIRSN